MVLRRAVVAAFVAAVPTYLAPCAASARPAPQQRATMPPAAASAVDYQADVVPIFARACYSCHGPEHQRSDYRLDLKSSALAGGDIGHAILPGDSLHSPLIEYVAGVNDEIRMPKRGEMLTPREVGILRRWIDDGAAFPDEIGARRAGASEGAPLERPAHWAYQPLAHPVLPEVRAAWRIETPIDAFVLAKLEEHGLDLAPPADRRTLLRRVTFDLTGLPPTPDELAAFLADDAPGAYERTVDRLLASPRYGERCARRWIDLVHFAETHGNDQDRERPHAWPYRDWLIDSFNADKPYARFVQEQLAGDVLFPDDPQATVALGFLAAGPWDESSQLSIVDDTQDKQAARNLDRDDMVMTTVSTFLSSTIHCARCHDHKFDPFSQSDYYRLQAVFAGIDRADRPYDSDPATHVRRQQILKRRLALEVAPPDAALLTSNPDVGAEQIAAWEASLRGRAAPWHVLTPASVVSANGQTATVEADGSVLFGGALPEVDTVTVAAELPRELGDAPITALRLDVLTDESLPFHGPGRQDNGNLHVNEIALRVESPQQPLPSAVPFRAASADFDQEGWTSSMAIDGNETTAWGIWPQVGRDHHAVFELDRPRVVGAGERLVVTIAEVHGGHHLIGRLRLAVTAVARPVVASRLPEAIAAILALPAAQRSAAQSAELVRHRLLERIDAELAQLPPPQWVYAGTTDFAPQNNFVPARGPRPIHVLTRGEISKPGAEVGPGALRCIVGLAGELPLADASDEGERRAALARWITDPDNALAWRSIVNRAWQNHFGRGIVATPSDFGTMGAAPSHPGLLDWLATWFRDSGGSQKALDRLIVTSAAYRQSARFDARAAAQDRDDALLWRMNRSRLDAEEIRDSLLQISGELDLAMHGPSVKQFVEKPGIHVTPDVDYESFAADRPELRRRSIYRFLFRTLPDPFMETLECPDASQLTPTRTSSVTPLQALALLNNPFVLRMSERTAAACGDDVDLLFRRILLRAPTDAEHAGLSAFALRRGLAATARLLFNSDDFLFVE